MGCAAGIAKQFSGALGTVRTTGGGGSGWLYRFHAIAPPPARTQLTRIAAAITSEVTGASGELRAWEAEIASGCRSCDKLEHD
jgi:hypothetical protein